MRKVIIEFKNGRYLVICREDRVFEFKRGEEGRLVEFIMEFLGEDAVHNDNTGRV